MQDSQVVFPRVAENYQYRVDRSLCPLFTEVGQNGPRTWSRYGQVDRIVPEIVRFCYGVGRTELHQVKPGLYLYITRHSNHQMRTNLPGKFKTLRPCNSVIAGLSFVFVTSLIAGVVAGALLDVVTGSTASLIISAILAIATFGYVLLTFEMAGAMKQQTEHAERSLKLQRKPDIVKIIEEEIKPRRNEIQMHRATFNATGFGSYDQYQIDDSTVVERFPELETEFSNPQQAAMVSENVGVDAGDLYSYYGMVDDYCDLFDRAVKDLEIHLLKETDISGINPGTAADYAKSAFALEPSEDMPKQTWRDDKEVVIPLRLELDGYESKLHNLKGDIKDLGHELQREFGKGEAGLRQEYNISRADV